MRWRSLTPTHSKWTLWTLTGAQFISLYWAAEWVSLAGWSTACCRLSLRAFQAVCCCSQQICLPHALWWGKYTQDQACGSGGTTPVTFNLVTTCGKLPVPSVYPRVERSQEIAWVPVDIEQETGWVPIHTEQKTGWVSVHTEHKTGCFPVHIDRRRGGSQRSCWRFEKITIL